MFAETFPVFIGIRKSRIRFNLFRIPVEIIDDTSSAQYQTNSTETYAFGKGNTGGVGSDYDREGVNGRECRTHGRCEENGTDADNRVITKSEEYRHQYRIKRHRFFFNTASGTTDDHQHGDTEDNHEFIAFGPPRERHQAGIEGAGFIDDTNHAAEGKDKYHNIGSFNRTVNHAFCNIADTFRILLYPLIRSRNSNRLFNRAFGKIIQVYFDIELIQRFLGRRISFILLLIRLNHKHFVSAVIR